MKISKKASASLLLSSIFLGGASPLVAVTLPTVIYAAEKEAGEEQLSNVSDSLDQEIKDKDKVTVIVKLKESEVDPASLKSSTGRQKREQATKAPREAALKEITKAGIKYKKLFEYDLLFNGFALETTYAEAKKIQALSSVDSVELSVDYTAPQVTSTQTSGKGQAIESNNIIDIQSLWDRGIKGQGQVVAIIDSGLDPDHDILRISDVSTAKFKDKAQIDGLKSKLGIDYGKWYSDKLVYAFNYSDWNDDLKEEETTSHGMHVTGSAVGNPSKEAPTGDYVAGVAPEAQLMFMRVFSDRKGEGSTSSFIYMKAVEDAVKMGADVINMSLGGPAGSVSEVGEVVTSALKLAKDSGVTVTIAAGNSAVFGNGYSNPSSTSPDYGLVGNPSVAADSISVAAVNNTILNVDAVTVDQLKENATFNNGDGLIKTYKTLFDSSKEYQYVNVDLGKESDYEKLDVKDKVVLVKRGDITFVDKVKNAKAAGAAGIIIYNHEKGGEDRPGMSLDDQDVDFPVVSMGYSFGNELAQHADSYTLKFTGKNVKVPFDQANTLTDFTSWGVSVDGELKPDVTAPGGNIYSSFNDNTYGTISGTSMAAPHTAGASALVKQVLKQRFPDLTGEQMQALIKHLIMSTANPNFNTTSKAYTSPRQQGAGIIDTTKAALGEVYLTGANDYGSVSLGNVGDKISFDVIVHNLSDTAKDFKYTSYLNTDEVENGSITLRPRQLQTIPGTETVHVPAKGQATVKVELDASQFTEELQAQMQNGYYLEGFVIFSDTSSDQEVASIPYVGFKGAFQDLPVFEKPIYSFTGDSKPFYYYLDPKAEEKNRDPESNFTALFSNVPDPDSKEEKSMTIVLGEVVDDEGNYTYDGSKIAFSPNNDGVQDDVFMKGVALRNYQNLNLAIYGKDDTSRKTPLYQYGNASGVKNFYDNGQDTKSGYLDETTWLGQDQQDKPLPDGTYQYVVRYLPQASGSNAQEMVFNVTLDTVAPKMKKETSSYDAKTRTFKPAEIVETGSGIATADLYYEKEVKDDKGQITTVEDIIEPNEDGSYTIPADVALESVKYVISDYAGNTSTLNLSDLATEKPGRIQIKLQNSEEEISQYAPYAIFKVTNEKGELVSEEYTKDDKILQDLPYGTYKIELVLLIDEMKLLSDKVQTVTLSAENPEKEVMFNVEDVKQNRLTVTFDKAAPEGTKVYAVSSDGTEIELLQTKYNPRHFEKQLVNGDYTIRVQLPDGYSISDTDLAYTVGDQINRKDLTLNTPVEVSELATAQGAIIPATVQFDTAKVYNTTTLVVEEQKDSALVDAITKALDSAITDHKAEFYNVYMTRNGEAFDVEGKRVINLPANGSEATVYVQKADASLEKVAAEIKDGRLLVETSTFGNLVVLYPEAKETPTTPEKPAETPANKSALETELKQYDSVVASTSYQDSKKVLQDAYQQAAIAAQAILNQADASQADVDTATENLVAAKKALEMPTKPSSKDDTGSSTTPSSSSKNDTGSNTTPSSSSKNDTGSRTTPSSSSKNDTGSNTTPSSSSNNDRGNSTTPSSSSKNDRGSNVAPGSSSKDDKGNSSSPATDDSKIASSDSTADKTETPSVVGGSNTVSTGKKVVTPSGSSVKLPSTGEMISIGLVALGVGTLVAVIIIVNRRKEKDHEGE